MIMRSLRLNVYESFVVVKEVWYALKHTNTRDTQHHIYSKNGCGWGAVNSLRDNHTLQPRRLD